LPGATEEMINKITSHKLKAGDIIEIGDNEIAN
jgi:hypothetical protein